ncbi:hypothetical protein A3C59_01675 [Candidatus Daviesbacteria bacterium RIFCSPHIGHO2_02_FULL_36_13]|uniref:YdbS-like PH domain-containing protein n=1 Tax=Candidatus Daviesbacteria bacterium RIFCSPHIGHO2_02_FULL_36_13 TaxID=1797768 RepID=A0A1F5JT34_9BACT|nr:MAG: hypothetical protein A3C59_01675 [Candidatus Daviesbacteria bacterium RIFCSPHIGHO2_02_FULL_36_13]
MSKFHYKDSPSEKQKKAFKKFLSEDEELILVTGLSSAYIRSKFIWYLIFPGLIFFGALGGIALLLGFSQSGALTIASLGMIAAAILKTMHLYHSNRYLLTTRRVVIKKGIFGVKLSATLFDKITHLEVDQSFTDRLLLHHGTIIINTAGMSKGEISLKYVDYPMELKNLLERLINREREQFGLRGTTLTEVEGEIVS